MSMLFMRDRSVISSHVNNIFKEKELQKDEVCAFFAHSTEHVAIPGKEQTKDVEYINLNVIFSVGYRVKSPHGVRFRQLATQRLKDCLVQRLFVDGNKRIAAACFLFSSINHG
jgi:hypothetical protein